MTGRFIRGACGAVLALGLFAMLGAAPALAYGTPTYTIYVNGPFGGTIDASGGAPPLPAGACGMRLTNSNVLAWDWYEGGTWPDAVMDVENNGWMPPANQLQWLIEFTGPFGGTCNGEYVFHTPATPTSEPPPGAVALVVQFVDADDVEFLDFNFQVYDPPDPPEPEDPPDPGDICKAVPEFCELPDSVVQDPCHDFDWLEICNSAEEGGRLVFGIGRIVDPKVLGLAALGGGTSDGPILRAAMARAAEAMTFGPAVNKAFAKWFDLTGNRLRSPAAEEAVSDALVSVGLGSRELQQCHDGLRDALRLVAGAWTTKGKQALLVYESRAHLVCGAAARAFADAHEATTLFAIALRSEH